MGGDHEPAGFTRREVLLSGAAAAAAIGLAACGGDGGGQADGSTTTDAPSTTRPPPTLTGDPFTLGVASGDPTSDGVVLWTRLAPTPLATDGLGGMPDNEVDVVWEVADDDGFEHVVARGVAVAAPKHAHSVHAIVDGLDAATDYRYRFVVGDHTSPTGRTRTLADSAATSFSLAVVNCQWYETGTYAAYRHLQAEDVDLVLHLGDYIYEYPGAGQPKADERSTLPTHQLASLTDYRLRYASYKHDPELQGAHARFPFVLTWDDHEVANNYMGDTLAPGDQAGGTADERKQAAYQAWWEHQPTRIDPPDGSAAAVYQTIDVGELARLHVLDERQYSDVPPCRDQVQGDFGDCADRTKDRDRLGSKQEQWLNGSLEESHARWNLIGNPVVLAGVDGGNATDGSAYYLDTWDGFPTARHRLIEQLHTVDNPVVLTGDYHAGMILDVHAEPFQDGSPLVAPEFMAPPISSPLFDADVTGRTPQLQQQINGHGYLTVEVGTDELTVRFRVLADVKDPGSAIATAATYVVAADDPKATRA